MKMRVKVLLNNIGLVMPVVTPKERVSKLMSEIAKRFEAFGVKPGELRIAELRIGQFLLNPRDMIEEVVENGDIIEAIDYDTWLIQEEKNCHTDWVETVREDFDDNVYKWGTVGFHDLNKLYVKIGTGWPSGKSKKVLRLEIFDIDALQYFSKDGQVLIASKEGPEKQWAVEAYFIVFNGKVSDVRISVKSGSDRKATIKSVGIKIANNKLSMGQVGTIQENVTTFDPSKYSVPKSIHEGPVLTIEPEPAKAAEIEVKSTTTTKCNLEVLYKGLVEVDQGWVNSSGKFPNIFHLNMALTNRTDATISISKISIDYKNSKGEWAPVDFVALGQRRRYYDYWYDDNTHFKMEAKSNRDVAVRATIMIALPTFTARRRIHKSLPCPAQFRVTFTDIDNGSSVIECEAKNTPLDLPDKSKIMADYKVKQEDLKLWAVADDVELEGRLYALAGLTDDGSFLVKTNEKSVYLRQSTLISVGYQACKKKEAESLYEDLCSAPHPSTSIKAYMLVDLDNGIAYGLKIVLQTTTSKTVESIIFPVLKKD